MVQVSSGTACLCIQSAVSVYTHPDERGTTEEKNMHNDKHQELKDSLVKALRAARRSDNTWLAGQYAGLERAYSLVTGTPRAEVLEMVTETADALDAAEAQR